MHFLGFLAGFLAVACVLTQRVVVVGLYEIVICFRGKIMVLQRYDISDMLDKSLFLYWPCCYILLSLF